MKITEMDLANLVFSRVQRQVLKMYLTFIVEEVIQGIWIIP